MIYNQEEPRVFADNVITLSLGGENFALYIGQSKIRHVVQVVTQCDDDGKTYVYVAFPPKSPINDEKYELEIEEEIRVLSVFKWVKAARSLV